MSKPPKRNASVRAWHKERLALGKVSVTRRSGVHYVTLYNIPRNVVGVVEDREVMVTVRERLVVAFLVYADLWAHYVSMRRQYGGDPFFTAAPYMALPPREATGWIATAVNAYAAGYVPADTHVPIELVPPPVSRRKGRGDVVVTSRAFLLDEEELPLFSGTEEERGADLDASGQCSAPCDD